MISNYCAINESSYKQINIKTISYSNSNDTRNINRHHFCNPLCILLHVLLPKVKDLKVRQICSNPWISCKASTI